VLMMAMKRRTPTSPGRIADPILMSSAIMGWWSKYPQS